MTHDGERSMFLDLKLVEGGIVAFRGMGKGKIIFIDKGCIPSLVSIDNVLYVENLKYNMLIIIQLCDNGYIESFNKDQCIVKIEDDGSFFTIVRHNNMYEMNLIGLSKQNVMWLLPREDERLI